MGTLIATIHGNDGKLLGVTFDGDAFLDRDNYDSWEDFLMDFASIAMTRLPEDRESDHAKKMISKDGERLQKLKSERV